MAHYSTPPARLKVEIDPGIKGIVALVLMVLAGLSNNAWNMAVVAAYLLVITVFVIDDYRFVVKSLASYAIIFIVPYLIGLLLSRLVSLVVPGGDAMTGAALVTAGVKLLELFFLWYIGSLYFTTTPFGSIAGMLNRFFRPINGLGVPVTRYLHMVVGIVEQLTQAADLFMNDVFARARQVFSDDQLGIRPKLQELADILATFIATSLQQTEQVHNNSSRTVLESYRLRIGRSEILAVLSLVACLLLFYYPPMN